MQSKQEENKRLQRQILSKLHQINGLSQTKGIEIHRQHQDIRNIQEVVDATTAALKGTQKTLDKMEPWYKRIGKAVKGVFKGKEQDLGETKPLPEVVRREQVIPQPKTRVMGREQKEEDKGIDEMNDLLDKLIVREKQFQKAVDYQSQRMDVINKKTSDNSQKMGKQITQMKKLIK